MVGCASAPHGKTESKALTPTPIAPYVRIAYPSTDVIELQIAVRKFVPEQGPGTAIWLVGASHVGESNYYAILQQRLDAQPLVLYEGVSARAREVQKRPKAPETPKVKSESEEGESLQDVMAQSLGLAFQLNAIDYYQPNFRNSDMTIAQLQDYFQKKSPKNPDEAGGNAEFQHLMEMMQGKSIWSTVVQAGLRMIGSSPKLQSLSRLVMIETLGQMRGNMAQFQGLGSEMKELLTGLIQERNKVVLRDLKAALRLPKPPASVGIFYGAAHMEDMQKRLCAEFHYRPEEETWLAAFSVNTAVTGISDAEASLIHSWVKWELELLQRRPE